MQERARGKMNLCFSINYDFVRRSVLFYRVLASVFRLILCSFVDR